MADVNNDPRVWVDQNDLIIRQEKAIAFDHRKSTATALGAGASSTSRRYGLAVSQFRDGSHRQPLVTDAFEQQLSLGVGEVHAHRRRSRGRFGHAAGRMISATTRVDDWTMTISSFTTTYS